MALKKNELTHSPNPNPFLTLLKKLNAFDSRHLDEIHFDVRLMAFQKSIKYIKEMNTMDMRYLLVIMHICFHSFEVSKKGGRVCVCTYMCTCVCVSLGVFTES